MVCIAVSFTASVPQIWIRKADLTLANEKSHTDQDPVNRVDVRAQ